MIWVKFFEYGAVLLVVTFFVTQLVIPVIRGTPFLPILRSKKLEKKLVRARQEVDDARLRREIAEVHEDRDDLDIETSRITGDGGEVTQAEYDRLCRQANERKRQARAKN